MPLKNIVTCQNSVWLYLQNTSRVGYCSLYVRIYTHANEIRLYVFKYRPNFFCQPTGVALNQQDKQLS